MENDAADRTATQAPARTRDARAFRFPERYYDLHPDRGLNFQLNRMYGWVGEDRMLGEIREAAATIRDYGGWTRAFTGLAEAALAEERTLPGAYYLRLAEFFMFADDPRKRAARDRFVALALAGYGMRPEDRELVPFRGRRLPLYHLRSERAKDTVVVFGGYDSYIEEWLPMLFWLRDAGYDVVAFEGPGQGGALEEFGLPLTAAWHEPVAAVLDYTGARGVTLMGLSLGGCLVIRAAAFEPRVHRAIAFDVMTDCGACIRHAARLSPGKSAALRAFSLAPPLLDAVVSRLGRRDLMVEWGVKQGMHVMGAPTPHAYFEGLRAYTTRDVSPPHHPGRAAAVRC
ncbi:MAG: alpha/beta hydrolase [Candidatus Eremiobacteraeota bacterium]|nr:alpha/beta hydrolase [Candidatus Eremiobacteraeota bacterium]